MLQVNSHLLISLVPATMVVFLVLGLYKTFLERQVQSREHIRSLLGETAENLPQKRREQGMLLKRRKKGTAKEGEPELPLTKIDLLETRLERANLLITANEFFLISLGVAVVIGILGWLLTGGNALMAFLIGILGSALPYLFVVVKGMLRMAKAAAQFADVLDSMVNAFKAGFGFSRAVQMVADNYGDPWGTEFGKMGAEMNLGASMEDSLNSLTTRIPSPDVDLFVTALLIQKETGGSMAELLGTLSKTIRDRYKLFQKVNAISAQGRLSASIICCVPFLLCGIMFLFLPKAMMDFVTNPIGIVLLAVTGFWMVCGIGVLYKIVQIEV